MPIETDNGCAQRRVPRLPACRLCHQRKVKCDNKRPKCAPCTRSGEACILIFPGNEHVPVSREDLYALERRELVLAGCAEEPATDNPDTADTADTVTVHDTPVSSDAVSTAPPDKSAGTMSTAIEGGGFGFMTLLFNDSEWRKSNAHLVQSLGRPSKASEVAVEANALPTAESARYLFEKYLTGSHVQNPFLLRHDVQQLFLRIYSSDAGDKGHSTHDLFRTFMVLAIASVVPYRMGLHPHHPYGYYLAAMQNFDGDFLSTRLASVQDLLLICRFGIYHHIGTPIWDTIQLCGRLCIELGLHRPKEIPVDILQEQIERRVFWEYYMIDRYSSTTLNRPLAIADREITVRFAADADDETILAARGLFPTDLDGFISTHAPHMPTEMSVFLMCIRLRKISARMQTEFSQLLRPSPGPQSTQCASVSGSSSRPSFFMTGHVYTVLDGILQALDDWRRSTPVFANPGCLYETQEWYDLLLARERLHAIRKAVDLAPKHSGMPGKQLLSLCLDAAMQTIQLYSDMFRTHMVTYTRSYFHTMFTAALSVMFCVSSPTELRRDQVQAARDVLVASEETLTQMGTKLPDARGYVTAFEALHKHISPKLDQALRAKDRAPHVSSLLATPAMTPSTSLAAAPVEHQPSLSAPAAHHHSAHLPQAAMDFYGREPLSAPYAAEVPTASYNAQSHGMAYNGPAPVNNELLQWAFFSDDATWNVEAGLSEYVYGDPNETFGLFSGFDFGAE